MAELTLITNVEFVEVNGVRCDAHAVLVQPPDGILGNKNTRIRGFGTEGADPVFTVFLDTDDSECVLVDASDPTKIIMSDATPDGRPLFAGAILTVGEQRLYLQISDHKRPFKVETFDTDPKNETFRAVWDKLERRVAEFWMAPNMPTLRWVQAEGLRS